MSKGTAVALFAGIGATANGLRGMGFDVYCVENNPVAAETLRMNFGDSQVIEADVNDIDWNALARTIGPVRVVEGGPPCQPFSQGGLQEGQYDPRDCIPNFIEAVGVLQPEVFLMEEVWTLTWKKNAVYFDQVLADLEAAGYVVDYSVLRMDRYGVEQQRKRLFVAGVRADLAAQWQRGVVWPNENPTLYTMAQTLGWDTATAFDRATQAPGDYLFPDWVFRRASTTVVGSFRPEVQAAPGYRVAGDRPRQYTPGSVVITEEEALVLQGLPRDWRIAGNEGQRRLQIGNACPGLMTELIVKVNL